MTPTGVLREEGGYSLVEVRIMIISLGLFAAVALPVLLGQRERANDASTEGDARNLVSAVEACAAGGNDYTECDEEGELQGTGLSWGDGAGQVEVLSSEERAYKVRATARGGHRFVWERASDGAISRTCEPAGRGACDSSGEW